MVDELPDEFVLRLRRRIRQVLSLIHIYLLGKDPAFDLSGGKKIYARNTAKPATFIARSAELHECFISEGCEVYGMVNHSIISTGCAIGKGAEVTDSVIMPDVVIENGAIIRNAIIAEGCHVKAGAQMCIRDRHRRRASRRPSFQYSSRPHRG